VQPSSQMTMRHSVPSRAFSADLRLLPDRPLLDSALAAALPADSLRGAAAWLRALPYGRTASRTDLMTVITEQRGTCSSKHALLATLAPELELVVGIYFMSAQTNPAVGPVLAAAGLEAIPEAHCYLRTPGGRLDITTPAPRPLPVCYELPIEPHQIGDFKVGLHRGFLAAWAGGRDTEALWVTRERCIAALGAP